MSRSRAAPRGSHPRGPGRPPRQRGRRRSRPAGAPPATRGGRRCGWCWRSPASTWLLAMVQKAPCAADGWGGDDSRYAQMCYSDIPYLYVRPRLRRARRCRSRDSGRALPRPRVPGAHRVLRLRQRGGHPGRARLARPQPARTRRRSTRCTRSPGSRRSVGLLPGHRASCWRPFALLAACFLAGAHRGRPWDAMAFAAAPVLVLTGLVNWDLARGGLPSPARSGRGRGAVRCSPACCVGLGTAAKLYPLFLLGALPRRRPAPRQAARLRPAPWRGGGGLAAVNLPVDGLRVRGVEGVLDASTPTGAPTSARCGWWPRTRVTTSSPDTINTVSWVVFLGVCVAVLVLGLRAARTCRASPSSRC